MVMLEKLRPLRDCLLVERIEKNEEKTAGGIYIPEAAKEEKPQVGRVLAVGTGRITPEGNAIPMQVKKDDIVFFGKFSGTDASKSLLILREEDVLGIIEK